MSLSLENLSLERNTRPGFENVSFECPPGEALILRGPNGAGKTTLLRTLSGFLAPTSGRAKLFEVDLYDRETFQEQLVYSGHLDAIKIQLTVEENVRFWCSLFARDMAEDAFSLFDLRELRNRPAGACSAGQKRRLGLARLFISGRKLWLMDEPTVALDTASRDHLSEVVRQHLNNGGLAVIATHDPDLVKAETIVLEPPGRSNAAALDDTEAFL